MIRSSSDPDESTSLLLVQICAELISTWCKVLNGDDSILGVESMIKSAVIFDSIKPILSYLIRKTSKSSKLLT